MDKLKTYIDQHRADFDTDSLPEGHADRFRRKLEAGKQPWVPEEKNDATADNRPHATPVVSRGPNRTRLWVLRISFAAAAVIALLLLLRLPGGTHVPSAPVARPEAGACQAKQEFEELRIYYRMQIHEMTAQIEQVYKADQTPGGAELLKETKKVLHDNYMFEETVLPTLPCSNNGLFAINQHYSNSLESLSIMLREMERMSKVK